MKNFLNNIFNNKNGISKMFLIFLVLTGIFISCSAFAQQTPKIREVSQGQNIFNSTYNSNSSDIYKSKNITKTLEKNLYQTQNRSMAQNKTEPSELKAVVGKSQLIKFDEAIKRVSITDPSLADLVFISPKEMLINGKTAGETTLIIWGASDNPVIFTLFVQGNLINNFDNFAREVKKLVPEDDIDVELVNTGSKTGTQVALSGRISSSVKKEKIKKMFEAYGYTLIDNTETLTPQIMLEVKIVEVRKDKTKTSATNPTLYLNNTNEKINALTKFTYSLKFLADGSYTGLINSPNKNLQLALSKAESDGTIKVLAEPRLMAVNGQEASFNAGDQIPVVTGRDEYGGLIIEYKDAGVNVTFTPTILEDADRILLKIAPEINEPTTSAIATVDGFPVYGFTSRKTSTTVELQSNQTMVIGGLIRKKSSIKKTKVPFFSHLPIIGNILGDSSYSNEESELMIFVTPTIIRPDDVVDGVK